MNEEMLNILNDLSKKETTELALQIMELTADNLSKDKEIERLNNIITELESWLVARVDFISTIKEAKIEDKVMFNTYLSVFSKLQELKGSDKE